MKGKSGVGKKKAAKTRSPGASKDTASQTPPTAPKPEEGSVRGVPQSKIDQLRGTRDHTNMTLETVQEDYRRVGIEITKSEAAFVVLAVKDYTFGSDTNMRKAKVRQQRGLSLSETDQKLVTQYDAIAEYCQVAPLLPLTKYSEIYRGIQISPDTPEYAASLMAKKVGDTWDLDRLPSSFSTDRKVARNFSENLSGKRGILVHAPTGNLKHAPSLNGLSRCRDEYEVMVADYDWKIGRIVDNLSSGGTYDIYLEHQ